MGEKSRHGQKNRRGTHRPPPFRGIFLRPANDNRAGSGLLLKRIAAISLLALLALGAFWANGGKF
ncbi:MAG: hypothetical protein HQL43_03425 [Alphaproteobacteria bacterium]|nr:hypothetical protein [Alphaproteobacteria bacterium]